MSELASTKIEATQKKLIIEITKNEIDSLTRYLDFQKKSILKDEIKLKELKELLTTLKPVKK